mmetsp:Transcript_37830/g.63539  ORF Transcript_37830/g.63539 Transcript_37830/m.63539 type:complete len:385 (+) Transcript_37830:46-1200(+)
MAGLRMFGFAFIPLLLPSMLLLFSSKVGWSFLGIRSYRARSRVFLAPVGIPGSNRCLGGHHQHLQKNLHLWPGFRRRFGRISTLIPSAANWIGDMSETEVRRQLGTICKMFGVDPPPADTPLSEMTEALAVARARAATRVSMEAVKPTMKHPKGYPVVTVDIDGFGEVKFAIHTGANMNIISESLAEKTKAEGKEAHGLGSAGVQTRQIVTLPSLSIGGRELPVPLRNAAVAPVNPALQELGVEGLLGTQFLETFDVEFVFPKKHQSSEGNTDIISEEGRQQTDNAARGGEDSNSGVLTPAAGSESPELISGGAMILYPPRWVDKGLVSTEGMSTVTCVPLLGGIPAAVLNVGQTSSSIIMPTIVDLGSPFSLMNVAAGEALGL